MEPSRATLIENFTTIAKTRQREQPVGAAISEDCMVFFVRASPPEQVPGQHQRAVDKSTEAALWDFAPNLGGKSPQWDSDGDDQNVSENSATPAKTWHHEQPLRPTLSGNSVTIVRTSLPEHVSPGTIVSQLPGLVNRGQWTCQRRQRCRGLSQILEGVSLRQPCSPNVWTSANWMKQ